MSGYAFSSLDEVGEGFGFRKVRRALGVTAFGVNAIVYPPGYVGFRHWHDKQDELYFVHRGRARVEVGDEVRELGDGPGFRKVRRALGVTAFGVNGIVFAPGFEGFLHYHDTQDELYFVHRGRARVEVGGEVRELGPGGLLHVEATTPRKVSNASEEEDLVLLVVGGKDGYVERDGRLVDMERDLPRRQAFGS